MADIDLERRRSGGMGWLWGILGLLALLALIWWIWPGDEEEVVYDETVPTVIAPATTPEPMTDAQALTVANVMASPGNYIGQSFPDGQVTVAEVPTDRGFWIESEGNRMFAIIIDQPAEEPVDITAGQTLRIQGGTVRDASYLPELAGDPLDADTERLAREQQGFLVIDEANLRISQQAGSTP